MRTYHTWEPIVSNAERRGVSRANWFFAGCFALAVLLLSGAWGCQSVKNVTHIYVFDSERTTITSDGGSNAKPVEIAHGLKAEIPASALGGM